MPNHHLLPRKKPRDTYLFANLKQYPMQLHTTTKLMIRNRMVSTVADAENVLSIVEGLDSSLHLRRSAPTERIRPDVEAVACK